MINQIIIAVILVSCFGIAYGEEPIKITLSDKMDLVKFDGKWSNDVEWKRSSLDRINDDEVNHQIQLRTAHQGNFIYIMIDFVTDETPQKDKDFAIVCLDTLNEKNIQADENDFCFKVFLENDKVLVFQGTNSQNNFQIIDTKEVIGVGATSDENDRYSLIPHSSYEFRIPTDLVGRSNNYGFFVGAFDADTNTMLTWPTEITIEDTRLIPTPDLWGDLISPDNSIPEFDLPLLILLISFVAIIYFTKKYHKTKQNEKEIRV